MSNPKQDSTFEETAGNDNGAAVSRRKKRTPAAKEKDSHAAGSGSSTGDPGNARGRESRPGSDAKNPGDFGQH